MRKIPAPYGWLLAALLVVSLLIIPGLGATQVDAQVPPGPPPPRPTPLPTARLSIANADKVLSPVKLTKGQPMTYTLDIRLEDSSMSARDAVFELPLQGNQEFVSFATNNPKWKLREPITRTLFVNLGTMLPGDDGKITIKANFATNYEKTVFRQTVYLNWADENYYRHVGTNLTAEVTLAPYKPIKPPAVPTRAADPALPTSGPFAPAADPGRPNSAAGWYFPATRHTLRGEFLNYWQANGSVVRLGFPISEEFNERGRLVQYFERVVMEFWPENDPPYQVLLRSLGRDAGKAQPPVGPDTPSPSPGSLYSPESGHWLDGRFVAAWQNQGGLAQFGYPIGEPKVENNRLVQWTERARFELDLSRSYQLVTLGLLGREAAQSAKYLP